MTSGLADEWSGGTDRPADGGKAASPAGAGRMPRALTVAGSDSGGGAGIQADLKTFTAHGLHGMSALTAVTVQNSLGVSRFIEVPPDAVGDQIDAVVSDMGTDVVKTGMLAGAGTIRVVVDRVRGGRTPVVVDPVAASQHGDPLLADDALSALRDELLPLATVATPNVGEVRLLTGVEVRTSDDLEHAARAVHALGSAWVLVKGGHLDEDDAVDVLYDGATMVELRSRRIGTVHTHGSGDTLASALAARLALGDDVVTAARGAKAFVAGAIEGGYALGAGLGPVDGAWRSRS